jgi:hypothetical protein
LLSVLAKFPYAFLAPGLVLAAWAALWFTGRRVGWQFFLSAAAVAGLCIPAALLIEIMQPPCYSPTHDTWACGYSIPLLTGMLSAVLTAGCIAGLLLLTAFFKLFGLGPGPNNRPNR